MAIPKVNLFLVGAAKAGTTSMTHYLESHPDVFMSAIKEPHYFSRGDINPDDFRELLKRRLKSHRIHEVISGQLDRKLHRAYINNESDYQSLFKDAQSCKIIGEASTSYLWSPTAAQEIYKYNPDARIIIMLRNPVDRAFSHYVMDRRMQFTNKSFEQALQEDEKADRRGWGINSMYIELGMYYDQVKRYYDIFPAHQIHLILFDSLKLNIHQTISETFQFLNINPFLPKENVQKNIARLPRNLIADRILRSVRLRKLVRESTLIKFTSYFNRLLYTENNLPDLPLDMKEKISKRFKADILLLEKLIHKDLSIWYNYE